MISISEESLKNRIGKFRISDALLHKWPMDLMKLFGHTIIIRAEHHTWPIGRYEYLAVCPLFDELSENEAPPLYEFVFQKNLETNSVDIQTASRCDYQESFEEPQRKIEFKEFL